MPATTQFITVQTVGDVPNVGMERILTTGTIYFVDSNNGNNTHDGLTPATALQTLTAALDLCTAYKHDIIVLMPNFGEIITSEIGIAKAQIEILGEGEGDGSALIEFATSVDAKLTITGIGTTIRNVRFANDIDNQVSMIDLVGGGSTLDHCRFYNGSAKQALTGIRFADVAAERAHITCCKFFQNAAAGSAAAIEIALAVDQVEIDHCEIVGNYSDAGIHNPTGNVATNLSIKNNVVRNVNSGNHAIELVSACTGTIADNRLYADNIATVLDPGACNCFENKCNVAVDEGSRELPSGGDDVSAIYSDTTIIASDLVLTYSDTTRIHSDTVVIESNSIVIESDIIVVKSDTTAVHSQTTKVLSDTTKIDSSVAVVEAGYTATYSDTTIIASDVVILVSDTTQIASDVVLIYSDTTIIYSDTSIIYSDTTIIASDVVILVSDTTAIHTQTTTIASDAVLIYSDTAIIYSDTSIIYSDTTIIASDVVILVSDTTAMHTQTTTIASDVVILVSDTTAMHTLVAEIGGPVGKTGTCNDNTLTNNTQVVTLATATGGDIYVEQIVIEKDATLLAGPTNVELSVDNVYGNTGVDDPVMTIATATLAANTIVLGTAAAVLALTPFVLESGKKIFIHGSDGVGTSAGAIKYGIIGRRLTASATLV